MSLGFKGKILRVNLTRGEISKETPKPEFYRKYVGGRNIAAYYLLKELEPNTDPLSPKNKLVFATSILTGIEFPGTSRFTVAAKSPLTGGYGEAEAGGWWGPELKFAGYDAVIIEGKADSPVYIWVNNEEVKIKEASHIWGKTSDEAQKIIRSEVEDDKARIAQIGPAGENLVRFAAIVNELRHFNGRTGLGAVMGSKNLKAIAVRGSEIVRVKSSKNVEDLRKWFTKSLREHPGLKVLQEFGTPKNVLPLNEMGLVPTYNFRAGRFQKAEDISGERIKNDFLKRRESCRACPVACKRIVETKRGEYDCPEWEPLGALGPNCGISDLEAIFEANKLCNKYVMDAISCGVTIAFAMECFEKGIITEKETDGIRLNFGNGEALVQMCRKIAMREGFGNLLAEGSWRVAEKLGKKAQEFSMTVKKQELPSHEPRGKWGVGLGYAVSPTGADHLQAAHDTWFDHEGDPSERLSYIDISDLEIFGIQNPIPAEMLGPEKVRMFKYLQCWWSLHNVLDLCIFVSAPEFRMISLKQLVDLVEAVTGWQTSVLDLIKLGERGITMARAFNIREGFGKVDDKLPTRLFTSLDLGKGEKREGIGEEEFNKALEIYYEMMGWDPKTGTPLFGRLAELGIEWIGTENPQYFIGSGRFG